MSKTALVTGGNSGIGYATARLLKARGYDVVISGRDETRVKEAAEALSVKHIIADLSNKDDVHQLAHDIREMGPLNVLVNNAAIARLVPYAHWQDADFDEFMTVNVYSPLALIKGLLPALEQAQGSVTNVSSAVVNNGVANLVLYAATKGAIEAATKSLALELAERKVRVNAVSPGAIDTPIHNKLGLDKAVLDEVISQHEQMIPLSRFGRSEEVADVIVAQLESTYVTGTVWPVDGGVSAQ